MEILVGLCGQGEGKEPLLLHQIPGNRSVFPLLPSPREPWRGFGGGVAVPVSPGWGCFPAAPYWLDQPENLILAPGEDGRLVCRANGNPKPTIQWLVNGEPIECE